MYINKHIKKSKLKRITGNVNISRGCKMMNAHTEKLEVSQKTQPIKIQTYEKEGLKTKFLQT